MTLMILSRRVRGGSSGGGGDFSAINALSTELYNPSPHPYASITTALPRTRLGTRMAWRSRGRPMIS
jgi:hypothetical protein